MKEIDYKNYECPSDYYKADGGSNIIRVVSKGFMAKEHGMRTAGRYLPLGECVGANCEHCKAGREAKIKYKWIVLDRAKQRLRLLHAGKSLGDGIASIGKKFGDPQEYDLEITRKGEGRDTNYTVIKASVNTELGEKDKVIIDNAKTYLVNKYFK